MAAARACTVLGLGLASALPFPKVDKAALMAKTDDVAAKVLFSLEGYSSPEAKVLLALEGPCAGMACPEGYATQKNGEGGCGCVEVGEA